jgi:magnesium-transporting ATPase (P-type)
MGFKINKDEYLVYEKLRNKERSYKGKKLLVIFNALCSFVVVLAISTFAGLGLFFMSLILKHSIWFSLSFSLIFSSYISILLWMFISFMYQVEVKELEEKYK